MELLRTAIAHFVPGSQLLTAVMARIGATTEEQSAVVGLYDHFKGSPLGPYLPPTLDDAVKVVITGKSAVGSVAPVLTRVLAIPGARGFVSTQADALLKAYPKINDVIAVVDKAANEDLVPASADDESVGQYLVRVIASKLDSGNPAASEDNSLIIQHVCPRCNFAHVVHAGE